MNQASCWLNNEDFMKDFVSRGGADDTFHDLKRNLRCSPQSSIDEAKCGYVYIEPNLFSEGPLWVYTSAERQWMPFVLQPDDTLSFYDQDCNERAKSVLQDLSGEQAIDLFLKYWCSLEPRGLNRP